VQSKKEKILDLEKRKLEWEKAAKRADDIRRRNREIGSSVNVHGQQKQVDVDLGNYGNSRSHIEFNDF
jgi:hypothetical protein